ncbi:MAG: hypothetical protein JNM76_16480 [Betaproteobacteria bacterium]|nr:hypothetical protein [Betaproteobacteria bacterium]
MTLPIVPEFDIADHIAAFANALFHYRVKNDKTLTNQEWDNLRQMEHDLLLAVIDLRAQGVGTLAKQAEDAKGELTAAIQKMNSFTKRIKSIQKALKVASSAIGLAGALLSGNVQGIVAAAGKVKEAAA